VTVKKLGILVEDNGDGTITLVIRSSPLSEKHLIGSELGPLQNAIWKKQFEALRDGDRFFYANDPVLNDIAKTYRITYRKTLADVIRLNTGLVTEPNVFFAAG
jgi:hypothetical protein